MSQQNLEQILKLVGNDTISRLNKKQTKTGILKELQTLKVFKEIYPSPEVVLKKIFEARSLKTSNMCPRCGCAINLSTYKPAAQMKYTCKLCFHFISPLVGTPLERTHIKLNLILEIAYRTFQSKHGLTISEISRDYGISFEAATNTMKRVRLWMSLYLQQIKFDENAYIEMDEVFPKKPTNLGRGFKWSRGMGSERIAKTITMVQRGSGVAKGFVVDEVNRESVDGLVKQELSKTNKIRTDEKPVYKYLSNVGWDHDSCNHNKKEWVNNDAHTNTCESLHSFIQGNIRNTYRGVKNTQRYVDEACFVFSNRQNNVYEAIENLFNALPPFFTKIN